MHLPTYFNTINIQYHIHIGIYCQYESQIDDSHNRDIYNLNANN